MHIDLVGPWYGWKQRGPYLVSPDGEKMTVERLKGIEWRHCMDAHLSKARMKRKRRNGVSEGMVKVVIIDLQDWHAQHFGSRAG